MITSSVVLELVIEAMVDAVLVIDAEGLITMANAGAAQLTGFPLGELRGKSVAEVIKDESSGLRTGVRRRIENGNVLRREHSWLVTKVGERVPVSVTGSPVVDGGGVLQGIVLVARDIRELRQLLADKEAEITRRRHAEDKLFAVAAGFGHELRNIAQVQVAAVDELEAALSANEDITARTKQILPELARVGEHISQHGQRLMELARPEPDRVAAVDLNEIVRDAVSMLGLAGKLGRFDIVLDLAPVPLHVTVNRTRIEEVLVNLVANALDADATRIRIQTRAGDKRVACAVHDDGVGIPPDLRERIFEPFFTTKGDGGTGLGLSVVRDILASHGGTIAVDSEVGRGTTFTFELPV